MGTRNRHTRTVIRAIGICVLAMVGLAPSDPASAAIGRAAVEKMLTDAQEKAQAGQLQDAVVTLRRIVEIEPDSSEAWEWLGFCYIALGSRAAAIEAYATHLKLEPESTEGWAAMNRLFFDFEGQALPSSLNPDTIAVLPVTMQPGDVLTPNPDGGEPLRRHFGFTTSVVFPKPMVYPDGQRIPSATAQDGINPTTISDPRHRGLYNRVSYGYVYDPETARLELKLALHYPSPTLSEAGADASNVANAAMANLLRLWWLVRDTLGRVPSPENGPLTVWLTTEGEAGGEQWQNNVYLYNFRQDREPAEWLREVAHEWGHLLIPGIDGFEQPEAWANGMMGESLFLKWLAESAQGEGDWAIEALWPGPVDLRGYLAAHNDMLIQRFLIEGPNSPLLIERGRMGMEHLVGLVLFAEAAHGAEFVRCVFDTLTGDQPPDLMRTYKDAIRALASQGVSFDPRLNIPVGGTRCAFTTLADESGLTLQPGQKASYWVYLPDGNWTMQILASTQKQAVVSVASEDMPEVSTVLHAGDRVAGEVELGEQPDGWKQLTVSVANAECAVTLEDFILVGSGVGPSPFAPEEEAGPAQEQPAVEALREAG